MKKMYLVFAFVLLFLLPVTCLADQIPFGSAGHHQRVTMVPGEIREFKLSFFNNGDDPLVVEMEKDGSREIITTINPRYFILEDRKSIINPMGEEEWVALGKNYIKAVPVHVTFRVPSNISELTKNYHIIKIVAFATTETSVSGGTRGKMNAAHEYSYAITVPGNVNAGSQEEYEETLEEYYREIGSGSNTTGSSPGNASWNIGVRDQDEEDEIQERGQLPTGFISLGSDKEESSSLFYLIIIAIIFVFVYLLYKKFRR